jgi:hypothetical protein
MGKMYKVKVFQRTFTYSELERARQIAELHGAQVTEGMEVLFDYSDYPDYGDEDDEELSEL